MFFKDNVHIGEVIKWGLFAGVLEGFFIGISAILYTNREVIMALAGGWEFATSLILLVFVVIGAIITTVIVFAHPIFSLIKKNYRDAIVTVLVTLVVIVSMIFLTIMRL